MKKNLNTKSDLNVTKKAVLFSGFLVLLLVLGSSIAMADSGLSENSKALELKLAPTNPDFVKYEQDKISNEPGLSNGHKAGYVPSPVDLSHLSAVTNIKKSFPSKYDLRTLNKVTSVKDQGIAGSCWAFATYGSLESYLLPGESWDFSENNLKNVLSNVAPEGFDFKEGGTPSMSTAYMSRGSGPVDEKDDPYSDTSTYSSDELGLPIQKDLKETIWIPSRQGPLDNDGIKSAIQKYGAIDTAICYDDNCYSPTTHSYYYSGSSYSNHAVTIVGWDDSYDRNNFSEVPPGDGAFIVKNSWGSDWGENGYFYMSYYDSKIGSENAVFMAEDTNSYSIYQYDPLGWVSNCGFGTSTAWCANIFTAKSDEILKAVSFYTTDSNCKYEIYVSTDDASSGTINKAGAAISESGTSSYAGYHMVPLDSEVQLKAGQNFAVIIKLTTTGYSYPIAMEYPLSGYSSKATANAGESFISSDGQNWDDVTKYFANTNVCIKAFTTTGSSSPVADFSAEPTSGNVPLKVQFTDDSTGLPTSWNWNFGDGKTSTSQNPAYTYSKAGSYTVSLTVKNAAGTNTKTMTNYITVKTTPVKPVAAFSASPTSGNAPLKVQFTDKSTNSPTSWNWNFGDGKTSTSQNPAYTYSKAGTYTVSLTVKNAAGTNTKTISKYITVKTAPVKPVAAFSASPTSGNAPLKVQFTDKSTNSPTSWNWNFGDGKTSTSQNPAYTYSKAGTYTVSLTVKNAAGTNTKTISKYITVKTAPVKPVAAFSAKPTSGKASLKVQFTDKSTNSPTSWKWSFGDGKTSTSQNPAYTYSKAGSYTVSLTVKNAAGSNTKTISGYIKVSK